MARRRAAGVAGTSPCTGGKAASGRAAASGAAATAAGTAAGAGEGPAPSCRASPGCPIQAMVRVTGTTSPSFDKMRSRRPEASASTSMEVLSVSISSRISPLATSSPSFLSQRRIVPSSMDMPVLGMMTGYAIAAASYFNRSRTAAVMRSTVGTTCASRCRL